MSKIKSVAPNARGSKARLLAASSAGAVAIALALGGTAQAQTTIDTTSAWTNDYLYSFGETQAPTLGQTFTAPAQDVVLNYFSFYLNDQIRGLGGGASRFRAYVAAWDGSQPTTVLFQSGVRQTALSADFEEILIDTGALRLSPGAQYVAYFDVTGAEDGVADYTGFKFPDGDPYAGGQVVFRDVGSPAWNTTSFGTRDLVFRMGFSAPLVCAVLSGDADTCAITSSSVISGTADALGGTDTVQLGGADGFTFNADTLGVNFLNFEQVRKTGASTVTLTGSAELPVYVSEGTLRVSGSVTNGNGGAIIVDGAGATVDVDLGGSVTATGAQAAGVYVTAANGTLINGGTIEGYYGAYFNGAGSVTNEAGGSISSTSNAVAIIGAGTVTNGGIITNVGVSGLDYPTVYLGGGGTVVNQLGGQIVGGGSSTAVYVNGAAGTVTNDGLLQGGGHGVVLAQGGTLTNHNMITGGTGNGAFLSGGGTVTNTGAIISTGGRGVQIQGGEGELTNTGTISGAAFGARLYNGGTVINGPASSISGAVGLSGGTGVANANQAADDVHALEVFNDGYITGSSSAGGVGVKLEAGGSIANREGGQIQGATGVEVVSGDVQLTNHGSIVGTNGAGVKANGGLVSNSATITGSSSVYKTGADALSVNNYGTLNGQITQAGTGVLTFWNFEDAAIYGTHSAVDSQGGALDVDNAGLIQGGAWGVVGRNADDKILNSGTIKGVSQDGVTLASGGELTNTGVVTGGSRGVVGTNAEIHNQAGGVIVGGGYGADLYGVSTLDNAGTIAAGSYADGVVTLGGYDGVRMNGGRVNNLAGGVIKSGAYAGIYSYGGEASISNVGSITSNTGNGLYLRSTVNDVTNLAGGTISGGNGINVGGGLSLNNAGLIKGTGGNAVYVESGAATITNSGSLISTNPNYTGVYTNAGGSLTNLAGGTINGGYDGVRFGGSAVVDNAGSIVNQNAGRYAMIVSGGGSLTNREGGSVAGKFRGVYFGANGTVTNDGSISAVTDNAVSLQAGGAVTNTATGVISSAGRNTGGWGVWGAGLLQVDNAGAIDGESGVVFTGTGGVTNRAGGVIEGRLYGVLSYPEAGVGAVTVDNTGTISGGTGVSFAAGGTVVNRAGGEIGGGAGYGVQGSALAERVENAGDIHGSVAALDLGGGDDTFVMITGGTIGGHALGGAGTDALILDGEGEGSLDVGLLGGFESQTKIGDGVWTLSGADAMGLDWSIEAGTLRVSGGHAIGDGATVSVAEGATFALKSDETIAALSGEGTVNLGGSTLTLGDGEDSVFDGVIGDGGGLSFVGSWNVSDGPEWNENPAVYSGQEAAALLFGGQASDYTISTVSDDPTQVNYSAWMDGWGDEQYMSNPAPQDLHVDLDGDGYANPGGEGTSYSAYVSDHGGSAINYAFRGAYGSLVKTGSGVLTLNGANTFSGTAYVQQGTLRIGGDERLSDAVTLAVAAGASFDLQGYDETVKQVQLAGTLAGTGTLNADEYWLLGGTVDANLGEGALVQVEGDSLLNGLAGSDQVELVGGSLTLGASERFENGALVQVDEDAILALDGWDETVGQLWGEGVVDLGEGGGLTLGFGGGSSTFAGSFTGAGDVTKVGDGVFTLVGEHDFDGALVVEGGQVRMAAVLAGDLHVKGGLLAGVGEIGGDLKITGGTVSPGGTIGTAPSIVSGAGLGVLFTNTLTVSGGTLNFGFAGADLDYASDHIVADGAIHLSGGVIDLHPVSALGQYGFNQQYLLVEGDSLTGQFSNLSGDFTANAYEGQLFQRLRYDVVPGGVVLEVRRMVDWTEYDPTLQGPVGEALGGTQLKGSDEWAGVLNTLLDLTPEERHDALEDMSGEGVANVSASTLAFGDRFQNVMQGHMNAGGGGGAGAGGGTAFAALPFGQGARSDVMGGMLGVAEAGLDNRPGGWAEAFVVDSTLKGEGGAADAGARGGGFATGADFQTAPAWRVGFALGFSDMQGDTTDRSTASEGRFWHAGAYASYSDGPWYGGAAFSRLTGDIDVDRQIGLGPLTLDVAGSTSVSATNVSINAGRRFALSKATELRVGVSGTGSKVQQDGYTETGAGGLSLNVGEIERQLFVGEIGARVTHDFDQGRLKPYVGAGAAFAGGDLESLANVGFSGAPTGTGTFVVQGAELPSEWARLEAGVAFKPRENVWLQVGYDGSLAERLQEHRGTVKVSFKW